MRSGETRQTGHSRRAVFDFGTVFFVSQFAGTLNVTRVLALLLPNQSDATNCAPRATNHGASLSFPLRFAFFREGIDSFDCIVGHHVADHRFGRQLVRGFECDIGLLVEKTLP